MQYFSHDGLVGGIEGWGGLTVSGSVGIPETVFIGDGGSASIDLNRPALT